MPLSNEGYPHEPDATESDPRMHELNKRAQANQFKLATLAAMDDDELIYLAAHDPAVETFGLDEVDLTKKNKLESNARRARLVLGRRWAEAAEKRANTAVWRSALIAGSAAIFGSIVGAVIVRFL
jgi:hypothetical protein